MILHKISYKSPIRKGIHKAMGHHLQNHFNTNSYSFLQSVPSFSSEYTQWEAQNASGLPHYQSSYLRISEHFSSACCFLIGHPVNNKAIYCSAIGSELRGGVEARWLRKSINRTCKRTTPRSTCQLCSVLYYSFSMPVHMLWDKRSNRLPGKNCSISWGDQETSCWMLDRESVCQLNWGCGLKRIS